MKRFILLTSMILAISAMACPLDRKEPTRATRPAPRCEHPQCPRYVCGVLDGTFTFEQWGTNWWEIYSIGEATGMMKHLGPVEMYTKHTPNLDYTLSDGVFTIVTADGDEIRGTYTGVITWASEDGLQYHGTATLVISEGTGRFAHASGTINATFSEIITDPINWSSADVTWTLSGLVSY